MAIVAPGQEFSKELARELLMAISDSVHDKLLNLDNIPENFDRADGVQLVNGDGAEKYRSDLISISYTQLPDVNMSPVALVKP